MRCSDTVFRGARCADFTMRGECSENNIYGFSDAAEVGGTNRTQSHELMVARQGPYIIY